MDNEPVSLLIMAKYMQEDLQDLESLRIAEQLQLEEVRDASLKSYKNPAKFTPRLKKAKPPSCETEALQNAFQEQLRVVKLYADTEIVKSWAEKLDKQELQDHEYAMRLQKLDEDGYDIDKYMQENKSNVEAADSTIESVIIV